MQQLLADVISISPLTEFIFKVELKPAQAAEFKAGQYLQVVLGEKDKRAFSIASKPSQTDLLELHIGAGVADGYARQALDHLRSHHAAGTQANLEVGLGVSELREKSTRPIILLAGGTGFSYVKSMAYHLQEVDCDRPVFFYWGVKDSSALYADDEMKAWAASNPHFNYIPVIENPAADWQGHSGYVHLAVLKDFVSLVDYDIYMAGRFDMIGIVRDDFINQGAIREQMYADAFAFIK